MSDLREQEMIPEQLKKLIDMARGGYGEHSETAEWALREIDRFQQKITMLESRLASLTAEREEMVGTILSLLRRYWRFDDQQQHTHSWHDREDCMEKIRAILRPLPEKGK